MGTFDSIDIRSSNPSVSPLSINNQSSATAARIKGGGKLLSLCSLSGGEVLSVDNTGVMSGLSVPYAPAIPSDHGLKAWSWTPTEADNNNELPTAGLLNLVRLRRVPVGPIRNLVLFINSGGDTLTTGQCFAALFTADGTHLRTTADQSVAWATSGIKLMAITLYDQTSVVDLYMGFWFNGTTGPSIPRGALNDLHNVGLSAPNFAYATADADLTTEAPATIGTQTALSTAWWCGLAA